MNPTADWEKVGDRYYRKIQVYTAVFDQDLELENHILTGAPYGGAIGMFFVLFYNVHSHSLLSNCCFVNVYSGISPCYGPGPFLNNLERSVKHPFITAG